MGKFISPLVFYVCYFRNFSVSFFCWKLGNRKLAVIFYVNKNVCNSHAKSMYHINSLGVEWSISCTNPIPTTTPRVFHVERTCKRLFARPFNVEYTWSVCKDVLFWKCSMVGFFSVANVTYFIKDMILVGPTFLIQVLTKTFLYKWHHDEYGEINW